MRALVIFLFSILIIGGIVYWKFAPNFNEKKVSGPVTLTVWGFWEEDVARKVIESYKHINPGVAINYVSASLINYRTRVQTQVVNKQGPDIFVIHNTWVPMFLKTDSLFPAPSEIIDASSFSSTFYPVAKDSFVVNNKVYGVPLSADGLALFYNEDILRAGNVVVPKTWDELVSAAVKLTVKDKNGQIQTAGLALGSTANVDYWADLLGLLFLQQPGVSLISPNSQSAKDVLRFFTSFIRDEKQKVWDESLPQSLQFFSSGKLAFYFGTYSKIAEIKKTNPTLNFKVAAVPQLPGGNVAWGSFLGAVVSNTSNHPKESWDFLKFLSSKDTQSLILQGAPPARVDLRETYLSDPFIGAFVIQAPFYKSWFLASNTQDQGLNTEVIKLFEDAVMDSAKGFDPSKALDSASRSLPGILDKYTKVSSPQK